jgi:hypothetical protein
MYAPRLRRTTAGPSVVATLPAPDPARATLRRIVSEIVILQDEAEELLDALRDERDLGGVAPTCGRLIGRFVVLGEALKGWAEPALAPQVALVRSILDHHVLLLNSALMFLASEWRSERLTRQLDALDGLGAPARRLERVWADLGPGPAAGSP